MNEKEIFNTIEIIVSGISATACLLAIIIYIIAKPLRTDAFKIIFWLNLNNFIKSFTMMFPSSINEVSEATCKILAYFTYSSSLSGLLWTALIAIKAYKSIIQDQEGPKHSLKIFTIIFFILPYSICTLPFFFDSYGPFDTSCVLMNTLDGNIFRFTLYFIPAIIIVLLCFVLYSKILRYLKEKRPNLEKDFIRLRYFPLILVVCLTPDIIIRFFEIFGLFSYYLYCIGAFLFRLQGFLDAMAYSFTPPVKLYLKLMWENRLNEEITETDLFKSFS